MWGKCKQEINANNYNTFVVSQFLWCSSLWPLTQRCTEGLSGLPPPLHNSIKRSNMSSFCKFFHWRKQRKYEVKRMLSSPTTLAILLHKQKSVQDCKMIEEWFCPTNKSIHICLCCHLKAQKPQTPILSIFQTTDQNPSSALLKIFVTYTANVSPLILDPWRFWIIFVHSAI